MAYGKLLAPLGGAPVFCTITVFEHCPGTMFPAGRLPLWGPICCPTGSPVLGAQGVGWSVGGVPPRWTEWACPSGEFPLVLG